MHVSFAAFGIYRDGGFPGRHETIAGLQAGDVRQVNGLRDAIELLPPACYHRAAFAFASENEAFASQISSGCGSINREYGTSPAIAVAEIASARIAGGVVSVVADGQAHVVYETEPGAGRVAGVPFVAEGDSESFSVADADEILRASPGGRLLWLGGGDDERVWLTDHLPRLAVLAGRPEFSGRLTILLERATPELDLLRRSSIGLVFSSRPYEVVFIETSRCYAAERLLLISPASQPPFLKSPHALRHLRDMVARSIGSAPPAVPRKFYAFDSSAPGLPGEANQSAIIAYLQGEGFQITDLALLSPRERAALFGSAELVVAPMQSALAATLFCRSGTALVYLAAEDEPDPFFWDLAAVSGHRYAVCYGPPLAAGGFDVEPSVLIDALALQWVSLAQG